MSVAGGFGGSSNKYFKQAGRYNWGSEANASCPGVVCGCFFRMQLHLSATLPLSLQRWRCCSVSVWVSEAWASDRRAELPLPAAASGRSGPNNPCYRFDSRAMGQPLVKATAKATAFCSAQLFANVAPKLHNDMRASMDNAVHANLRVNPVAKAFCDSYLSASSDDHSLTANVQVLSGGSVSAVVIAVVLTGQLWPLLLFMLLLVAGIGVGIVWALRCKEECDSKVQLQAMVHAAPGGEGASGANPARDCESSRAGSAESGLGAV